MGRTHAEQTFSGIRLLADPGRVMRARPATEGLVERAVTRLGNRRARVADVGTGSGAIAVAIALRAPHARISAVDVSEEAVALARANVARNCLENRVTVVQGDLLAPVAGALDLVVANLPYLPERSRLADADVELLAEPSSALFAPGDGLGPYRRLLEESAFHLDEDGVLLIQYRARVLEATRAELGSLLARIEQQALAA